MQSLWRSEFGDWLLYGAATLVVCVAISQSAFGQSRGSISFSIHESEPVVSQGTTREQADFSIHAREETKAAVAPIAFSVHDAKPLPQGDAKPCSEQRQVNRVLVFVDPSKRKEQRQVQICEKGKPCRWVMQTVEVTHVASQKVLTELERLSKQDDKWKSGEDECVHFKLVDVTNPANVDMVKELRVSTKDLPLLVKETDSDRRKKAEGMKAKELAEWYLKQYVQPEPEPEGQVKDAPKCLPGVGGFASGPQWDYHGQGTLRQHLTDPRGLHHLPRAVVDQWSDAQVQAWHNWHHEVMEGRTVRSTPATVKQPSSRANVPQARTTTQRMQTSLGYSAGSFQGNVAQFALAVAQSSARSPPSQSSFSSDPKKAAKAQKKWKHDERERIRKEVRREVWNRYSTFDPFTILTIISILIRVLSFVFDMYGLN